MPKKSIEYSLNYLRKLRKENKPMKTLTAFKKEMREYYKTAVDPEPGETFESWFGCLMDALREDKKVITTGNGKRIHILD